MMLRKLNDHPAFRLLLLFLFALTCLYGMAGWGVRPLFEADRDLGRAIEIANGHWLWYGPEFKYGGYSPGPFLYWLTSLPFVIGGKWRSALFFEIVLASLAAVGLYRIVETRHSKLAALFAFVFFLNGMVLIRTLNQFWNPSWVFLFDVILISFFWNAQIPTPKRMAGAGILLGCIIQIHALQALLIFDSLVSIFVDSRLEMKRRVRAAAWLVGGVAVALVPYFLWRIFDGTGNHGTWIQQVLEVPLVADDPMGRLRALFEKGFLQDAFLIAGAIVVLVGRGRLKKRSFFLLITAVVTLPNFLKIDLESIRYAIPLFFSATLLVASALSELLERRKNFGIAFLALVAIWFVLRPAIAETRGAALPSWAFGYLIAASLVTAGLFFVVRVQGHGRLVAALLILCFVNLISIVQTKANLAADWDRETARAEQFEAVLSAIKGATGWSFEELRPRLYITGDLELGLALLYKGVRPDERFAKMPDFDGVIAIYRPPDKRGSTSFEYPHQIEALLEAGTLSCLREEKFEAFDVCFYRGKIYPTSTDSSLAFAPQFESGLDLRLRSAWLKTKTRVQLMSDRVIVQLDGDFEPSNPMIYGSFESIHFDYVCEGRKFSEPLAMQIYARSVGNRLETIHLIGKYSCQRPADLVVMVDRVQLYRRDLHVEKHYNVGGPLRFLGSR